MKIFVTGAYGFIGANLIQELLRKNYEVIAYDLKATNIEYLQWEDRKPTRLTFGDIRDRKLVKEESEDCDATIHLAALSGIQTSLEYPIGSYETNVTGAINCLEAARKNNHSKFIFASSGGTILGHQDPPVHEEVPVKPVSPYGASKAASESYCLGYYESFGLNTTIFRFSNVYGPYIMHKTNLIPNILRAFHNDETFYIYGDGNQSRDFIHVKDLINAIVLSLENEESNGEIYQLATNRETTVKEITDTTNDILERKYGKRVKVEYTEGLKGEVKRNWADISKIKDELGWEPKYNLEEGLTEIIDWFWG